MSESNASTPEGSEGSVSSQQRINSFGDSAALGVSSSSSSSSNNASGNVVTSQHDIGSSAIPSHVIPSRSKKGLSSRRTAPKLGDSHYNFFRGSSSNVTSIKKHSRNEADMRKQEDENKFIIQLHEFIYAKSWADRIRVVMSFLKFFYIGFHPRYIWKRGEIGSVVEYHGRSLHENEDYKVWMGLFLDLIYVALMALLTAVLDTCSVTFIVLAYCYGILTIFYNSRFIFDEYNIRFSQDDLYHRFMYFLYILSIMFMCIFTGLDHRQLVETSSRRLAGAASADTYVCYIDNDGFYSRFGYAFYFNRSVLAVMYVVTIMADSTGKASEQFTSRIIATLASVVLYIISDVAVESSVGKVALLVFLAELDVIFVYATIFSKTYLNFSWMQLHYPVPYLQIQERNATFLLVVFGEIIISFVSFANGSFSNEIIQNSVFGFILVFAFATTYFDSVQRLEGEVHASRRHIIAGYTHAVPAHKMLGYFLLILSTGVINYTDASGIYYLAYGCSGTASTLLFAKILHRGFAYRFKTFKRTFFTLLSCVVAAGHLSLQKSTIGFSNTLVVHSLLAVSRIVIDVIYSVMHETTDGDDVNDDDCDCSDYDDADDDDDGGIQLDEYADPEADMYSQYGGEGLDRVEKISKVHAAVRQSFGAGAKLDAADEQELSPNSRIQFHAHELASSAGLSLAHHAHYRNEVIRRRTQLKRLSRARNCDATAGFVTSSVTKGNNTSPRNKARVAQAMQPQFEEGEGGEGP